MVAYKDIILRVDFFDFKDMMSKYMDMLFDFPECHVGLCYGTDYLLPSRPNKIKVRDSAVIYHSQKPVRSIILLGKEQEDNKNWLKKYHGTYLDHPKNLFFVTHANMFRDMGFKLYVPKTKNCIEIIGDTISQVGIQTSKRTPHMFYQELENHPMRVG